MPKEVLDIPIFAYGIVGALDDKDLPVGSMAYAENVAPADAVGRLRGIENDSLLIAGKMATGMTPFRDGRDLVLFDGGNIFRYANIEAAPPLLGTLLSTPPSSGRASGVSDGQAVYLGLGADETHIPKWVGVVEHDQFGNLGGSIIVADANASSGGIGFDSGEPVTMTPAAGANEATWPEGNIHVYASLTYDRFQEGPLQRLGDVTSPSPGVKEVSFTAKIVGADVSRRASRINFYTAVSESIVSSSPIEEPVFSESVELDATWIDNAGTWEKAIVLDGRSGSTYFSRTGVNAFVNTTGVGGDADHMDINYQLNTVAGGFHFIANCWHPDLPEANRMVFRSRPFRFSVFNWSRDFILLPETPTAIQGHEGLVYAFAKDRVFVIDPTTLAYQTIEGYGCLSQESVVSTSLGMFFVSNSNLYLADRNGVHPVGGAVLKNDIDNRAAWLQADHSTHLPCVGYDAEHDAFLVAYINGVDAKVSILMFTLGRDETIDFPRGRWFHVATTYDSIGGCMIRFGSKTVMSLGGDIRTLFAAAGKRSWKVTLNEIYTAEYAKYYHVDVHGDNVVVEYQDDGVSFTSAPAAAGGVGVFRAEVNGRTSREWKRVHSFQLRLSGTGDQEVDALQINRRRMVRT